MRHEPPLQVTNRSLLTRRRFQFAGALVIGALLPFALRGTVLAGLFGEPASVNALFGNSLAITIAFWMRLSIETYPGIRSSYVILPTALTGHGLKDPDTAIGQIPVPTPVEAEYGAIREALSL